MAQPDAKFIISAENRASGVLKKVERDFGALSGTARSATSLMRASLAGLSIGYLVREFVQATDTFKRVDTQLRNATRSTLEFGEAQRRLFEIAQSTRQDYATLATTFAQISASAGTSIGTQDQQLRFFETVSKAITLSGSSAEAASAALMQFRQGLASGVLRGEELNSVMEQTPRLARAIAEGLGVSIGQLREMGKAGELTADRIVDAMSRAAESINREFENVVPTFDSSMTKMGNSIGRLFDAIEKGTGGPVLELVNLLNLAADGLDKLTNKIANVASTADRVGKLQGNIRAAETGTGVFAGLSQEERDAYLVQVRVEMAKLRAASQRQFREGENATVQVLRGQEQTRVERAAGAWSLLADRYATAGEKAAKTAAEIRKAGEAAGKSEAEIQRLIRQSRPAGAPNGDPLTDLLEDARARDKALVESLEQEERFREFLARLQQDIAEQERETIADETERNRERADAWRDILDPTRKYIQQLEEINRLTAIGANAGGLSERESAMARFLVGNEIDGLFAGTAEKIKETNNFARELGLTFTSAFEDAIVGGKGLRDVLSGIQQDIMRIVIRKSITEPIGNWIATAMGGLTMRADGGPISAGRPYLVGERGPEVIIPKVSGTVVPNHQLGGPNVVQQFTINGEMSRSQEARLAVMMRNVALATMADSRRRVMA